MAESVMQLAGAVAVVCEQRDNLYAMSVIPRRSVDRVRKALAEGDMDRAQSYLDDIERGLQELAGASQRYSESHPDPIS